MSGERRRRRAKVSVNNGQLLLQKPPWLTHSNSKTREGRGIEVERVKNPTEMVAKGRYFHLYITIQIACVMM